MSVYIKGENRPKSCCKCAWINEVNCPDGRVYYACEKTYHTKVFDDWGVLRHSEPPKDVCPYIQINEHGRLIDADALKNTVFEALNDAITDGNSTPWGRALCEFIAKNIVDEIETAPTIIPASKEGE